MIRLVTLNNKQLNNSVFIIALWSKVTIFAHRPLFCNLNWTSERRILVVFVTADKATNTVVAIGRNYDKQLLQKETFYLSTFQAMFSSPQICAFNLYTSALPFKTEISYLIE